MAPSFFLCLNKPMLTSPELIVGTLEKNFSISSAGLMSSARSDRNSFLNTHMKLKLLHLHRESKSFEVHYEHW